jgi:hypothetical protein
MDEVYENWDGSENRYSGYGGITPDEREYQRLESRRMPESGRSRDYQNSDYQDKNFWHGNNSDYREDDYFREGGEEEGYAGRNANDYQPRPSAFYEPDREYREGRGYDYDPTQRRRAVYDYFESYPRYGPSAPYSDHERGYQRPHHSRNFREDDPDYLPSDSRYSEDYDFSRESYRRRRPNVREKRY